MKKFTSALLAAALTLPTLAAPALADAPHHAQATYHAPVKAKTVTRTTYKTFHKGERFDKRYARNYREIDYRRYRNVKAPPRGYHYVQSGNDILLVGLTTGVVAAVLSGMIH